MNHRVMAIALGLAFTIIGLSACTAAESAPEPPKAEAEQTTSAPLSTIPDPDSEPVAAGSDRVPALFRGRSALFDCDSTRHEGQFWICDKGRDSMAVLAPDEESPYVRPKLERIITRTKTYNPLGDTIFEVIIGDGVLWVHGSGFFQAELELAQPDDSWGATVVDTDRL